ncbi:MAG: KAP family NTPase, partial [Elioraea sp.]|nr:KAP family NTPase [Elioraea sp.]
LAAREADVKAVEAEIASLDRAAATPGAMLRFFLNESEELRAYEREIGLIGRLRRSFERLDELMRRQADPGTPTDAALPTLERIVLFVDDLDRLREEQVVRVLEAIALLLQFRLFVVVVAVDAGWLERALKAHYGAQFGADGVGPGEYLEKIFQVPFWLPRLAPEDPGHAALAKVLMRDIYPVEVSARGIVRVTVSAHATVVSQGRRSFAVDPDELPQPDDDTPRETRAATIRRVGLTEAEARVLEALFPLAGTSPRAIKRFVNLYRLARSARAGEALRLWLGEGGADPLFPAFALALAVENGFDRSLRRVWYEALRAFSPDTVLANTELLMEPAEELDRFRDLRPALRRARDFWTEDGMGADLAVEDILRHLAEASRLSFHPPEFEDPLVLPENQARPTAMA